MNTLQVILFLTIQIQGSFMLGSSVSKELTDKYKHGNLKLEINNSVFEGVNGESSLTVVKKCGQKECDISTEYCDSAVDSCMSCQNLCSPVRTTSPNVKAACEHHCKVFLYHESKKSTPKSTQHAVIGKNSDQLEDTQHRLLLIIILVISIALAVSGTVNVIVTIILCKTFKRKRNGYYGQNIEVADDEQTSVMKPTLKQTAKPDNKKKVTGKRVETTPVQPSSYQVEAYSSKSRKKCNKVTSNEDFEHAFAPTESGSTETPQRVAQMHSKSADMLTNSSGERTLATHPSGNTSTQPLLSDASNVSMHGT